nr:MAG TPA: hypothetical protein [Caudoviricetes sp.]
MPVFPYPTGRISGFQFSFSVINRTFFQNRGGIKNMSLYRNRIIGRKYNFTKLYLLI